MDFYLPADFFFIAIAVRFYLSVLTAKSYVTLYNVSLFPKTEYLP